MPRITSGSTPCSIPCSVLAIPIYTFFSTSFNSSNSSLALAALIPRGQIASGRSAINFSPREISRLAIAPYPLPTLLKSVTIHGAASSSDEAAAAVRTIARMMGIKSGERCGMELEASSRDSTGTTGGRGADQKERRWDEGRGREGRGRRERDRERVGVGRKNRGIWRVMDMVSY